MSKVTVHTTESKKKQTYQSLSAGTYFVSLNPDHSGRLYQKRHCTSSLEGYAQHTEAACIQNDGHTYITVSPEALMFSQGVREVDVVIQVVERD